MSTGVWNENAIVDETAEIRKAVKRAQRDTKRLERLKSLGLDDLVETAKSVKPGTFHGGRRVKGQKGHKVPIIPKYPLRDEAVNRNYRIVRFICGPNGTEVHKEYSPVTRHKVPTVGDVDNPDIVGRGDEAHYAHILTEGCYFDPEWLITTLEGRKASNGQDALKLAYELIG